MRISLLGYRRLARAPGVPRLTAAFLALGTSGTMAPVSLVLFARAVTGSFAAASGVLAAVTAGGLLLGPARGRLVDRLGPSPAVLALALPSVATDGLFIVAGHSGAGVALLIALGALAGAVTAPAGTALRSVWSEALADAEGRQTAYALMGVLQETNYILGPLLAGLLIAVFSATVAVVGAAVLNLIGGLFFATSRQARARAGRAPAPGRLPALRGAGMRIVLGAAAGFGATFGLLDVTFPAVARGHGAAAAAGILLSAFAAGSLAGGLIYGARPRVGTPGQRYPRACLLAAAGLVPLLLVPGLIAMTVLAAIAGLCFAPAGICQVSVIDDIVAPEHRGEAFSWLGTVYGAGLALGAAVAGQLVSASGVRTALGLGIAATAAAAITVTVGANRLAPPDPGASSRRRPG